VNVLKFSLLLFLPLMILSCATPSPKHVSAPKPPKIDCAERRATDPVPAPPAGTDWRLWAAAWAEALGWGEGHVNARAATADCLDAHRKAGDIR